MERRKSSSNGREIISFNRAVVLAVSILLIRLALLAALEDREKFLPVDDVIFAIGSGLAAAGMLYGASNSVGRSRKAWTILAISQITYFLGDASWAVIEAGLHQNPFPSLADFWYLSYYPILALGILLLPEVPLSNREQIKALIDAGIVTVASSLVFWAFIVGPIVSSSGETDLGLVVSVAYPVMDLVVFAALMEMIFRKLSYPLSKSLILLASGLIVVLIADITFMIQTQQGTYVSSSLPDTSWLISDMLFWLAGVMQANSKSPNQPTASSSAYNKSASWTQYLPFLGIGATALLFVWDYKNAHFFNSNILAGFIIAMVGLMSMRQKVVLNESNQLLATTLSQIEELNLAEKALQESENMYRAIFENTGTAMVIGEENTVISLANSEFGKLIGYSREEIEGKRSWTEFVAKEDLKRMLEEHKLRRLDPDAAKRRYEFRAIDKCGIVKDILLYVDTIPGTKKSVASLLDITERKRAEEELKRTQSTMRIAMDLVKLARWEYDVETDLFTFDDQFYALYGTTAEREGGPLMSSRDYAQKFIPSEESSLIAEEISKALATTDPNFTSQVEHRIIRADGTEGFIAVRFAIIKDDKGRTIKTYGANQDITERKQAEIALQESLRFIQDVIDTIPYPIFYKDVKGIYQGCNKAFETLLGLSKEEIIGKSVYDTYPRELADKYSAMDQALFDHPGVQVYEYSLLHADGTKHDAIFNKATYNDANGQLSGLVGMIIDITERKKMEEALQESRDYLYKIINSIGDPLFVKDRQHRMTLVNDAACKLFGRSKEEILGKTAYDLFPSKETAEMSWIKDEEAFKSGAETTNEETNTYAPGVTLTVLVKKTPYKDNAGNHFLVSLTRDITERKQAEDRIIASLQEKEILLKEVHHRVKNNLQIISSLLSLQSMDFTDDNIIRIFSDSQNRIKSMALVHENLYRSRDLGKVDFNEYLNQLVSYLSQSYGDLSRKIDFKVNSDNVFLNVNTAIPCGMIINELVSNSLKYAFPDGRSGKICIDLSSNDDGYRLIISDNGVGLKGDLNIKESKTLGILLIETLVKQIHGRMSLDVRQGTRCEVHFKGLM